MRKKILTEVNRIREIMYGQIISESKGPLQLWEKTRDLVWEVYNSGVIGRAFPTKAGRDKISFNDNLLKTINDSLGRGTNYRTLSGAIEAFKATNDPNVVKNVVSHLFKNEVIKGEFIDYLKRNAADSEVSVYINKLLNNQEETKDIFGGKFNDEIQKKFKYTHGGMSQQVGGVLKRIPTKIVANNFNKIAPIAADKAKELLETLPLPKGLKWYVYFLGPPQSVVELTIGTFKVLKENKKTSLILGSVVLIYRLFVLTQQIIKTTSDLDPSQIVGTKDVEFYKKVPNDVIKDFTGKDMGELKKLAEEIREELDNTFVDEKKILNNLLATNCKFGLLLLSSYYADSGSRVTLESDLKKANWLGGFGTMIPRSLESDENPATSFKILEVLNEKLTKNYHIGDDVNNNLKQLVSTLQNVQDILEQNFTKIETPIIRSDSESAIYSMKGKYLTPNQIGQIMKSKGEHMAKDQIIDYLSTLSPDAINNIEGLTIVQGTVYQDVFKPSTPVSDYLKDNENEIKNELDEIGTKLNDIVNEQFGGWFNKIFDKDTNN